MLQAGLYKLIKDPAAGAGLGQVATDPQPFAQEFNDLILIARTQRHALFEDRPPTGTGNQLVETNGFLQALHGFRRREQVGGCQRIEQRIVDLGLRRFFLGFVLIFWSRGRRDQSAKQVAEPERAIGFGVGWRRQGQRQEEAGRQGANPYFVVQRPH